MTQVLLGLAVGVFLIAAYRFFSVSADAFVLGVEFDDDGAERQIVELANRKRLALANLVETKLDFDTGKIAKVDYERIREIEREEAFELMSLLDEASTSFPYSDQLARDVETLEVADSHVRRARVILDDADSQAGQASEAARLRQRLRESVGECSKCQAPYEASDAFCRSCGNDLRPVGATA